MELNQLLLRKFGRSFLVKAFDFFSFLQRSLKKYGHERYDNSKEKHPNTDMIQHQGCLPPLVPPGFQDHVLLNIISQDPIGAFLVPWHVTTVLTAFWLVYFVCFLGNQDFFIIHCKVNYICNNLASQMLKQTPFVTIIAKVNDIKCFQSWKKCMRKAIRPS